MDSPVCVPVRVRVHVCDSQQYCASLMFAQVEPSASFRGRWNSQKHSAQQEIVKGLGGAGWVVFGLSLTTVALFSLLFFWTFRVCWLPRRLHHQPSGRPGRHSGRFWLSAAPRLPSVNRKGRAGAHSIREEWQLRQSSLFLFYFWMFLPVIHEGALKESPWTRTRALTLHRHRCRQTRQNLSAFISIYCFCKNVRLLM